MGGTESPPELIFETGKENGGGARGRQEVPHGCCGSRRRSTGDDAAVGGALRG